MIYSIFKFAFSGEIKSSNLKSPIKGVLQLFGIGLLIHLIFSFIKPALKDYGLLANSNHPLTGIIQEEKDIGFLLMIFFYSVLLHPLMEELSYRLVVVPNRRSLTLGLGFLSVLFVVTLFKLYQKTSFNPELSYIILFLAGSIVLSAFLFLCFKQFPTLEEYLLNLGSAKWAFVTSLCFAISHFNVVGSPSNWPVYILLFLPYFLNGYVLSYGRVTLGFFYAFSIHALNNGFFFLLNSF